MSDPARKPALSLHQAAKTLARSPDEQPAAEVLLAQAIEHGELHANVKRWATEQWKGQMLPGNLNRLETWIEADDLATWRQAHGR